MTHPTKTQSKSAGRIGPFIWEARLPLAILATLLIFAAFEPRIISAANLRNVAVQCSFLAVFTLAQTIVILTRGFDMSLGFTVSFVSVVSAMVMLSTGSIALGILAGLGVGLAIGLSNGLLVGGIRLNPLVTTLGMANIIMALASTVSGGFPVSGMPPGFTATFAQGAVFGIPAPILIVGLLYGLFYLIFRATRIGRSLYIIGANPRAAVAAGINSFRILIAAYVMSSLVTAVGAILLTARTGSGEPNLGGNLTLEAIAAAVVGGVRLSGGEGGVGAALQGALFVTVLSNGMNLVQIDGYLQQICLGAIIVISLILSRDNARR